MPMMVLVLPHRLELQPILSTVAMNVEKAQRLLNRLTESSTIQHSLTGLIFPKKTKKA